MTEAIAIAGSIVGGILIWAVRQEGRINLIEKQHELLMERLDRIEELLLEALRR